MNILISNDDGYQAPGIIALAEGLASIASKISVVAPEKNRSGASSSLTLESPLRAYPYDDDCYYVDGTPTDCVHLAITGLLNVEPDLVVSGINFGANLGDDVIYSGTVAAAIEGRFLGLPAIAISLVGHEGKHFATAAKIASQLVTALNEKPIPADSILNVNVPDIPYDQIKGVKITRLGNRHKSEPVIKDKDPRGNPIYWIGPAGPEADAGEGTDFWAVKNSYVSVTPIHIDLTQHELINTLSDWVQEVVV